MKNRTCYVLLTLMLSGCTMLEVPTMESLSRKSDEKAAAAILSDPSPSNRAKAAVELGGNGDPASVELLRKALRDPDPLVREAVAEALRESGDAGKSAEFDLMQVLQNETNAAAAMAEGWTLQRWKVDLRPALPSLLKVVDQKNDARSRYYAAILVSDMVEVSVVAPVYVDTLGTRVAKDARNKPEVLLEEMIPGHSGVVLPLLVSGAESDNPSARIAIAHLLNKFKIRPDPIETMRQLRANSMADVFSSVLPTEAEQLLLKLLVDKDPGVREAAAWSAGMCDPAPNAAGPLLLAALSDESENVRAAAVGSIGPLVAQQRAPAGSLDAMARLLNDPSDKVRADAALALAHIGELNMEITVLLADRVDARVEPDANVRAMSASALSRGVNSPELRGALLRGLRDSNETVVERSLASIGHRGVSDPEMLSEVAARITAANSKGVRLTALGTLRDLGPAAVSMRVQVLAVQAEPDADIREGAAAALTRMDE